MIASTLLVMVHTVSDITLMMSLDIDTGKAIDSVVDLKALLLALGGNMKGSTNPEQTMMLSRKAEHTFDRAMQDVFRVIEPLDRDVTF